MIEINAQDRFMLDIVAVQNIGFLVSEKLDLVIRIPSEVGPTREADSTIIGVDLLEPYSCILSVAYRERWSDGSTTYLISKLRNYGDTK